MSADLSVFAAEIKQSIRFVAGNCDFAMSADGFGFSGCDTLLGHALAEKDIWSERELFSAATLVVKYQNQVQHNFKIDLEGIKSCISDVQKKQQLKRISHRQVISGMICIENNRFKISSDFSAELRDIFRSLIGARWDDVTKTWNADLCSENAITLEKTATKFALELKKTAQWKNLKDLRDVRIDGDWLVIQGVNTSQVRNMIPKSSQEIPRGSFYAVKYLDNTSIAVPLNSWVIGNFLLWIYEKGEDSHLGWALNKCTTLLDPLINDLKMRERQRYMLAQALDVSNEIQERLAAGLPDNFSSALLPHQWVGIDALSTRNQTILADEPGLGKTIEILGAIELSKSYPAIVVAPVTALLNWRDEAQSWLPNRKVAVRGGGVGKVDQGAELDDADLVIINYESFDKFQSELAKIKPAALVCDEAQYLKGHDSKRTETIQKFCKETKVGKIIAATGTPVMNRASELLTLITLLPDLLIELGGFWHFATRYCDAKFMQGNSWTVGYWDFGGGENLGELANRLRETGRFVRRGKTEVLKYLPAKQYDHQLIEISNRDEYQHAEKDFAEWLKTVISVSKKKRRNEEDLSKIQMAAESVGLDVDEYISIRDSELRAEALKKMTALRQLSGKGKIQSAVKTIREIVKDEKLVVFAYHIEVQNALIEALASDGIDPLTIKGDTTAKARRNAIKTFQTNPSRRLIVCSLKAAQTAITLTSARRALIVELDWTPSALEQAEDRIHRIGQHNQVVVTYLVAQKTLDQRMSELLDHKRKIIKSLSGAAPFGYKMDGTPRLQPPGPGRQSLPQAERKSRRKSSKKGWEEKNPEYMRNYMRERREKLKVESARDTIKYYLRMIRLGYNTWLNEVGGRAKMADFLKEMQSEYERAVKAQLFLKKRNIEIDVPPPSA